MKKIFAGVVVAFVAVLTLGVAAGAQGTPTMTLDPDEVEEAGEHDIEVSLSGFSADIALFVLPCDYPEGGNPANLDTNSCDQANLMPVQMDGNGEGTVTVTYDIPEPGIAIIAGDAARTESAFGFLGRQFHAGHRPLRLWDHLPRHGCCLRLASDAPRLRHSSQTETTPGPCPGSFRVRTAASLRSAPCGLHAGTPGRMRHVCGWCTCCPR